MNRAIQTSQLKQDFQVSLVLGDITKEEVDAIVNAANSHLQHGGGVAAAISRAGGPVIQEESNRVQPVPVGEAKETSGGKLPAMFVIHAVGPRWGEGDEENKLISAVNSSLQRATELGLTSISLPAISTGIFGFPLDRAAHLILHTIREFYESNLSSSLRMVRICIFDERTLEAFQEKWPLVFDG